MELKISSDTLKGKPDYSASKKEDLELINRVKQGDDYSFERLCEKWAPFAYWSLLPYQRNDEDLKQIALLQMWRAAMDFDSSKNDCFGPILKKYVGCAAIKEHAGRNALKRNGRPLSLDYEYDGESFGNLIDLGSETPLEIAARNDEFENLDHLIQSTPMRETEKKILMLFLRGYNHFQISDELGIKYGSSRTLFYEGKKKIKNHHRIENSF